MNILLQSFCSLNKHSRPVPRYHNSLFMYTEDWMKLLRRYSYTSMPSRMRGWMIPVDVRDWAVLLVLRVCVFHRMIRSLMSFSMTWAFMVLLMSEVLFILQVLCSWIFFCMMLSMPPRLWFLVLMLDDSSIWLFVQIRWLLVFDLFTEERGSNWWEAETYNDAERQKGERSAVGGRGICVQFVGG